MAVALTNFHKLCGVKINLSLCFIDEPNDQEAHERN